MNTNTDFHPSQLNSDGSLRPIWPGASHFRNWHYSPFIFNGKPADLYFWMNTGKEYVAFQDLLIGIQTSEEDGDYSSPFIEDNNALHPLYINDRRNDVMAAYLIACITLGITPSFGEPR